MRCSTDSVALFSAMAITLIVCLALFNQSILAFDKDARAVNGGGNVKSSNTLAIAPVLSRQNKLTSADEAATLEIIQIALGSTADGAEYAWRCNVCHLNVIVRPTLSFKDNKDRICRHIEITLTSDTLSQTAEGIACRHNDGIWGLEG